MPRKFKVGFALPDDNSVDLYAQDLGFLAHVENGAIVGYNLHAGGGMGMTHGNANTFPYIARPICYVTPDQLVAAAEGVIKLFRDHGNRADRKRARLKYLVHDWGVERFRETLQNYVPFPLVLPRESAKTWPCELTATPVSSPKCMSAGSLSGSGGESKGASDLAEAVRASAVAAGAKPQPVSAIGSGVGRRWARRQSQCRQRREAAETEHRD